jgi:hypothetical protein
MRDRATNQGHESNNSYCARLDLPVPRVEEVIAEKADAKLFHLMVVALLEHGGPMSLEAIVDSLQTAGVEAATGDMRTSLLKSWHGRKPVFRDDRDWFALDVSAWELRSIIFQLDLRPSEQPSTDWQPIIEPVADDVPLTEEEVRAAFGSASRGNLSGVRRVAAVLDVSDEPMAVIDVEACLTAWNSFPIRVRLAELQRWPKSCVSVLEGEQLEIKPAVASSVCHAASRTQARRAAAAASSNERAVEAPSSSVRGPASGPAEA